MLFPTCTWRRAIASLVIAHGLAHAVLPLRGWMKPDMLEQDFMPLILYGIAVMGFTTGGLGLLGLTPFTVVVQPALVLASVYSLIALFTFGAGDLWWAVALDLAFLLLGLTGVYRRWPIGREHSRPLHRLAVVLAAGYVLYVACALVLWPVHRYWGSDAVEIAAPLPGDRPNRNAAFELQHAVTIDAPPEVVWQWVVQLGQDRAGFYSYDWLERAFGVDVHNVTEVKPEWQARAAGDRIRATQPGYMRGVFGRDIGWTVAAVQPARAMVLRNWGAFVLQPTADGGTRFIIRSTVGHSATPAWAAAVDMMAFELPHFIMERKMMLQIKRLAEQRKG